MGYAPEYHRQGVAIEDDEGNASTVQIVVRGSGSLKAHSDVGFRRAANGTLESVIEYDGGFSFGRIRLSAHEWLGRASQVYKEKQTLAIAAEKGYMLDERLVEKDGTVQLRFRVGD